MGYCRGVFTDVSRRVESILGDFRDFEDRSKGFKLVSGELKEAQESSVAFSKIPVRRRKVLKALQGDSRRS